MPIRARTPKRPAHLGLWRHWNLWAWFVLALVLCVGGVALWRSGRWLVHSDEFQHVRWGIVLAGESRDCERSDAAIGMFREGKIDTLVISATRIFKNRYQSEFMVDYYVQQGVPRDHVFEFRQDAYNTLDEAKLLVRQFRLMNLDTALIVTSTFHTARTRRIFRKLAQGFPVVLVAAADYHVYDPNAWWTNRESRKIWFDEWAKTLFTVFELWNTPPELGKAEYQGLTPDIWSANAPPPRLSVDTILHSSAKIDSLPPPPPPDTAHAKADAKEDAKPESKAEESKSADSSKAREADSTKAGEGKSGEGKSAEAKTEGKAAKDSLKKAEAKPGAEAKPAAKDSTAKKSLPRAAKKPAHKETKKRGH